MIQQAACQPMPAVKLEGAKTLVMFKNSSSKRLTLDQTVVYRKSQSP